MDVEKLVFIDETWASTNMTRSYGRAPRGCRCVGSAPLGGWQTSTFVAGLRHPRLIAPMVDRRADGWGDVPGLGGAVLMPHPEVRRYRHLSSHKVDGIKEAVALAGATVLYLPPYSPDLNPIETLFSKLKSLLRKAATPCTEELWKEMAALLDTVSTSECANYFASSGYVST